MVKICMNYGARSLCLLVYNLLGGRKITNIVVDIVAVKSLVLFD